VITSMGSLDHIALYMSSLSSLFASTVASFSISDGEFYQTELILALIYLHSAVLSDKLELIVVICKVIYALYIWETFQYSISKPGPRMTETDCRCSCSVQTNSSLHENDVSNVPCYCIAYENAYVEILFQSLHTLFLLMDDLQ
jgi:hypothetical protein